MNGYLVPLVLKVLGCILLPVLLLGYLRPWVCGELPGLGCTASTMPLAHAALWVGATAAAFLTAFNLLLWRTELGRRLGCALPDIRGTWRGVLTPTDLPPGVINPGPLIVFLVVRQTAFRVRATLFTMESQSRVLASEFTLTQGQVQLVYSYQNKPVLSPQRQTPPHLGTTVLGVRGQRPAALQGYYYTERLSRGDLKFNVYSPRWAETYQEALALPYITRPAEREARPSPR